jgi:hypothetical protein
LYLHRIVEYGKAMKELHAEIGLLMNSAATFRKNMAIWLKLAKQVNDDIKVRYRL